VRPARLIVALLAAAAVLTGTVAARADDALLRARAQLEQAERALDQAQTPGAQAVALARAIGAHETALAALRDGLRAMAAEDRRQVDGLAAERARLSRLLGSLQSLTRAPSSAMLVWPGGPVQAARSAAMMAQITPALQAQVTDLATRLTTLRALRDQQEDARVEARSALAALQALRGEVASSRGDGVDRGPLRARAREAARGARTLGDLAAALGGGIGAPDDAAEEAQPFASRRGALPPPVSGILSGAFGGIDPWGRTGQGVTFTAPAFAQVFAPADGTLRYAGPLIDYGQVVILEPADGWLFVLAGLGATYGHEGDTVLAGEPLGDLGGPLPTNEEFLLEAPEPDRRPAQEFLYVELRQDGLAVDPAPWFQQTRN
jgi:septal ring factor EnvC (AmiA/AmiB activator)